MELVIVNKIICKKQKHVKRKSKKKKKNNNKTKLNKKKTSFDKNDYRKIPYSFVTIERDKIVYINNLAVCMPS